MIIQGARDSTRTVLTMSRCEQGILYQFHRTKWGFSIIRPNPKWKSIMKTEYSINF